VRVESSCLLKYTSRLYHNQKRGSEDHLRRQKYVEAEDEVNQKRKHKRRRRLNDVTRDKRAKLKGPVTGPFSNLGLAQSLKERMLGLLGM